MGICSNKQKRQVIKESDNNNKNKTNISNKEDNQQQKDSQIEEKILESNLYQQSEQQSQMDSYSQILEAMGTDMDAQTKIITVNFDQGNNNVQENTQSLPEFLKELIYLEPLGQGTFGKVHKVFSKITGKFYAIKVLLRKTNEREKEKQRQEIDIMKKVNQLFNSNIIKLVSINQIIEDTVQESDEYIIMESGSCALRDILNQGRIYSQAQIKSFLHDICVALNECFKLRIAHRDMKPENLILNQFGTNYIISDFGEAVIMPEDSDDMEECCVGTPLYMSYEMFNEYIYWADKQQEKDPNRKLKYNPFLADISSLGMIVLELMGIVKPIRQEIRNGQKIPDEYKTQYPQLYHLVSSMMSTNQDERPLYQTILNYITSWESEQFNEKKLASQTKLKLYSKLDSNQLLELSNLYSQIERPLENVVLCKYCLENFQNQLNEKAQQNLNYLYGEALLEQQEYRQSLKYLQIAQKLQEMINFNDKLAIANIKKLISQVYYYQNEQKLAEQFLNAVLEEYQLQYGVNHPQTGIILLLKGQQNL